MRGTADTSHSNQIHQDGEGAAWVTTGCMSAELDVVGLDWTRHPENGHRRLRDADSMTESVISSILSKNSLILL